MTSGNYQTIEGKVYHCPECSAVEWEYLDDHDNGDWVEASYRCRVCGHIKYVELPD